MHTFRDPRYLKGIINQDEKKHFKHTTNGKIPENRQKKLNKKFIKFIRQNNIHA